MKKIYLLLCLFYSQPTQAMPYKINSPFVYLTTRLSWVNFHEATTRENKFIPKIKTKEGRVFLAQLSGSQPRLLLFQTQDDIQIILAELSAHTADRIYWYYVDGYELAFLAAIS